MHVHARQHPAASSALRRGALVRPHAPSCACSCTLDGISLSCARRRAAALGLAKPEELDDFRMFQISPAVASAFRLFYDAAAELRHSMTEQVRPPSPKNREISVALSGPS